MRVDVKDPDYSPAVGARMRVYIDGVLAKDVVAFDDVEGWVEYLARDEHGKLVIDREKHEVVRRRRFGPVMVRTE